MSITGLVLGGKTKYGLFACGVLDVFSESGISFPYVVSTSGASRAAAGFISGQKGRHFRAAEEEAYRQSGLLRRFAGPQDEKKSSPQLPSFDYAAYFASSSKHELALTDYDTGTPVFLSEKKSRCRFEQLLDASDAEPFFAHEVRIDGKEYFTGVLTDPIPLKRAAEAGCRSFVLILSEPFMQPTLPEQALSSFYWLAFRKHPAFARCAVDYPGLLKKQLAQAKSLKSSGSLFVIQPAADFSEKNVSPGAAYYHGRERAQGELDRLRAFLEA